MQRAVSSFVVILFLTWILPLGYFIKPSQEKISCDGQRAICMCSHAKVAKAQSKPIEGFGLKANSNGNKESNGSGGGAGNYYLAAHLPFQNDSNLIVLNDSVFLAYRNPSLISIDHVPKA